LGAVGRLRLGVYVFFFAARGQQQAGAEDQNTAQGQAGGGKKTMQHSRHNNNPLVQNAYKQAVFLRIGRFCRPEQCTRVQYLFGVWL
jgi:hypothetical protein